jgi:hypothetical protein
MTNSIFKRLSHKRSGERTIEEIIKKLTEWRYYFSTGIESPDGNK